MRAEIEIARRWVAKARNDLLDADNNLASAHVPTDLTPYAVAARYPDDDFDMPTIEDAREARQCAERVLTWLRKECPDLTDDETNGD